MRFDVARPSDPSCDGAAGAVQSVDEVLATGELARRPARARDFCAEKKALTAITREMAANPHGVLQKVAELAVELCHAESAGVSILEPDGAPDSDDTLRWQAASGIYARFRGQVLPREATPCGGAIGSGDTQLFERPARFFPRMHDFTPQILENLSTPWSVDGQAMGTVWAAIHTPGYRFDAEDARLLRMLGTLAATAWQTLRAQDAGRQAGPAPRVDVRTRLLSDCIATLRHEIEQRRSAEAALNALQARREDDLEAMRRLYELHARLATETSLPAALDHVLSTACGFARTDRGSIELLSEDGSRMEIAAVRGEGNHSNSSGGGALAGQSAPMINRAGETIGMLSTQARQTQRAGPELLRLMELLAWTAADVVERHRAQAELRLSEARQAYLLRLNTVLRRLSDPVRIQMEAARVLAEHLGASRAGYASDAGDGDHLVVAHSHAEGVPALDGRYRYADYGAELLPALRAGQTVVRRDIAADPGLGEREKQACARLAIAASVLVPLVKDARLIAVLFAHQDRPRDWSAAEVALIQETAERTWAAVERAHAVAGSEAARTALEHQSRFIEATLAALPDYIYAFDRDHRFVYVNRAVQDLLGRDAGQILGCNFADLKVAPDLAARLDRHLDSLFEGGPNVEDEVFYTSPTGVAAQFHFRWRPVPAEDGSVELVVGVGRDTTERRRIEARLREDEERKAFLLGLSDALRFLSDGAEIQGVVSRLIGRHLGASRVLIGEFSGDEVVIERDYVDGVASLAGRHPARAFGVALIETSSRGKAFVVDDVRTHPNLDEAMRARWLRADIGSLLAFGLFNGDRLAAAFVVHCKVPRHWTEVDIMLVRAAAERAWPAIERARAAEALKEADQRKDEFLATLAHELRNPLAPISNAVHLMRRPDGRRVTDRLMGIVERQVHQIVKLVDDLLDISRITRGKIELDRQPMRLADAVRDAVETSRPLVERARHQLSVTLPDEPLTLCADSVRLTQVLSNLINNAAKYTETGGRIWLDAAREGDGVAIRVRDNGLGIPAHQLARVFDMFVQAQQPGETSGSDGLGIGLAIVRKLVEMHGGTVEAHSPGLRLGSEFVVRLPLLPQDAAACPLPACAPRGALGGHRILVVDDNRDAADTLALLLESHGAVTRVVYGGEAALAELDVFMPDTMLLDLGMPGMDGLEVARRLRADPRRASLRIVALTGWGQENDRRRTREAGFDHHLTKPVDFLALEAWLTGH
jgi:PAS domain S-box-containing protein